MAILSGETELALGSIRVNKVSKNVNWFNLCYVGPCHHTMVRVSVMYERCVFVLNDYYKNFTRSAVTKPL